MTTELIVSLLSSIALIGLGFYFKYAHEKEVETKQMVNGYFKKHWYIFVAIGIICLAFDFYKIFLK